MVFSPRRRSAVALASFLALAAGPLILPSTAGAASSSVAVTDNSGDVVNGDDPPAASATPKADITGASVRYKNDFITFTMKLAEGDDLANPASLLFWFGSGGTQHCCDIEVSLRKIASGYEVALGNTRDTDTPLTTCAGSIASVDVINGTYAASVPASCIESLPATLNLWAANRQVPITGGIATDRAPDTQSEPVTNTKVSGYWAIGSDGKVYPFGDALKSGEPTSAALAMVDIEAVSRGAYSTGYWTLDNKGVVNAFGPADYVPLHYGNITDMKANEKAVSISGTPTGAGYWIFTNLGRAIAFGDATKDLGDVSTLKLNKEVLDSAPTPSGKGYYLVAADGGVFALGDAKFEGSMGDKVLNGPVQSIVPDPDGKGYWLVATDGGIFAFEALFKGSMGDTPLNQPVTGMVPFGNAYLMVAEDGGVFNFSDQPFSGSLGDNPPTNPIVSISGLS